MWDRGVVFCVDRDDVHRCTVPVMLLPGTGKPQPAATSDELAALLPGAEVMHEWRGPEHAENQRIRVMDLLARHTPA